MVYDVAESRGHRAQSKEQRAESKEQRAQGTELRAERDLPAYRQVDLQAVSKARRVALLT
jgi:hypothetical protein